LKIKKSDDSFTHDEEFASEHQDEDAELTGEDQHFGKSEEDEDQDEAGSVEDVENSKIDAVASDHVKIEYDEALQKLVDGTMIHDYCTSYFTYLSFFVLLMAFSFVLL
jgi:hypothetical protein